MSAFILPHVEDLDVGDVASLPRPYRYELRDGNLFVRPPSTFWHKMTARRLMIMLHAAGHEVLPDTGVHGARPRDMRLPDLGVVQSLPPAVADYSTLPGFAFRMVIEIVSESHPAGEYDDRLRWYAECGIAEYWIVDRDPERSHTDASVHLHRLTLGGGEPSHVRQRRLGCRNSKPSAARKVRPDDWSRDQ